MSIGGNETVSEAEIPDFGDPVPLPNPAVHQDEVEPRRTMTMEVSIGAFEETEIKTVLGEAKVILYSWSVDRGDIYSDFHGHRPGVRFRVFRALRRTPGRFRQ